jgi:branched-chain amino acid transport system ATP-binding protein
MTSTMLQTVDLQRNFGAVEVASKINFSLHRGERHALIGPNGAGKTTFVNLLTGTLQPSSGTIYLDGKPIHSLSPARRVKRGLVRTFQINQLFQNLSTSENVALAAREALNIGAKLLVRKSLSVQAQDRVLKLLNTFGLSNEIDAPIFRLPYGKQRLIEIAIAMALEPSILLLDEPAAGVAGEETELVLRAIEQLPADLTLLIIEHDMALVRRIAKRVSVLVRGKIMMSGTPNEVLADPRLHHLYLGKRHHA